MRIGAVEDELRVLGGGELLGDVEGRGRGEQVGAGDDALSLPRARRIGVVNGKGLWLAGHQLREVVDVDELEWLVGGEART